MLEIKDLNIVLGTKPLICDLSLNLNHGDKLAIIGEEGNGKSTLVKTIAGVCDYADITGNINYKNYKIGYLKQFFEPEELSQKVFDYLFVDQGSYYEKIKVFYKYLSELKIEDHLLELKLINLSGGEKIKIGILKLLLEEADILLLDEPSNDLDLETLKWLENFICNCPKPIMYISHDETLLANTANMILHLELIKKKTECKHTLIRETYDEYVKNRLNKITKQNQVAKNEQRDYDKQMEKLSQIKQKVNYRLDTITRADAHGAQLLKKKMKSIKSQEKRINNNPKTEVIDYEEAINLFFDEVSVPERKKIINLSILELKNQEKILAKNIKLEVYGNKHLVIIGKNGIGKTTLMKKIYEELITREDINLGYMPQSYDDILNDYKTPLDFLSTEKDKDIITKIRSFLGNLNITSEEMLEEIKYLSGGTKAKLFLLKLILLKCNVLLLDEPTRNLSPLSNPVIRKMLSDFKGTIISISHDRKYINEVGQEIYELTNSGLFLVDKCDIN